MDREPTTGASIEVRGLMQRVMANRRKLDGCRRHLFPTIGDNYQLGQRLTCVHCGGEMTLVEAGWYIRGWVAHGGDAQEIMADWTGGR